MTDITINGLPPQTTNLGASDILHVVAGGIDKQIPASLLSASISNLLGLDTDLDSINDKLNQGIPEWEVGSEYFIGYIAREVAGTKIYRSITNNNIGNVLTDVVNWELLLDLGSTATETIKGLTILPKQITISNGIDTDHDIDFTAGNFQFDDGSGQAVATALTKQIDAVWSEGDNLGGLDTGTVAVDSTYHMFAIHNPTSGISDALFSVSLSPTMPSGYTKKRRVGSIITNGAANIIQFTQTGNRFYWKTKILNINSPITVYTTPANANISTPLGISTICICTVAVSIPPGSNGTVTFANVYSPNGVDVTPSETQNTIVQSKDNIHTQYASNDIQILTNTSSQVRIYTAFVAGSSLQTISVITLGWIDNNL